jgi:guanylate kinase
MREKLIVISGPSGVGIGEIVAALFARENGLAPVVPVTARKMKEGERDGVGFFFFELEDWNAMKESGDLLETTEFAGNDYGTSKKLVEEQFAKGNSVLMERELDRAAQIKRNMPEAVCILVYPFDSGILKTRYMEKARSSFEVSVRTEVALKQINSSKLFCDREVDSGDADKACKEIISIINGN